MGTRLAIMKPLLSTFATFLLCFCSIGLFAQILEGTVKDEAGLPLPFASVYIDQSTLGVSTDLKGRYFFELDPGKYTVVYSYVGYETTKLEVEVKLRFKQTQDVRLKFKPSALHEVEIVADTRDRGTEIMKQAIANRKGFNQAIESYTCDTYSKTSLEKVLVKPKPSDSATVVTDEALEAANLTEHFGKQNLNLIEMVGQTHFKQRARYKEVIEAYHDYAERPNTGEGREMSVTFSADVGPDAGSIAPKTYRKDNPYLLYEDATSSELDFYDNLISFPSVAQSELVSPLASAALLSYKYFYQGAFYEGDRKIYEIGVEPRFKTKALFEGKIFIEDSTFALLGVDLNINRSALTFCHNFKIIQNYEELNPGCYLPVRREMLYTIREGRHSIIGNTRVDHSEYAVNKEFDSRFFGSEIKRYEITAFDQDSGYWDAKRPITLTTSELKFIHETDSLTEYFQSDEYFRKVDSSFNRLDWWTPLAGYGRRNRVRGNELYIEGLLGQVNPVGIGGYRHKLPGYFNKTFKSGLKLENKGFVDYGFRNKDIKGKLTTGFTYIPEKFVKTSLTVGDFYSLINNYSSIEQTFSRSNYVRSKTIGVAQRMEVVNGLFAELSFEYTDQQSIDNLQLSNWSGQLFGDLNDPVPFERYTKSELKITAKYRFAQKYVMKGKEKIIIGTDYPEIDIEYRKGLPGLFGSEVNYDYVEISASGEIPLARFGYTRWSASAGTYLNKANLRVLEHKYFRGSDRWFFSDPSSTFQLLDQTLHTPNEFFSLNGVHHFEGAILDKVPLVNRLKLQLAGGVGILLIPDSDFAHFEAFAGLERPFRIKEQLFKISVWGVTSDSNLGEAVFTFKFGISFFNTFTQKWDQ